MQRLEASLPGPVQIYPLELMQLADPAEQARLLRYVQRDVAAAARADAQTLLGLVDGYPGVLYQWTNPYQRVHMRTCADLERVAADAQGYRFSELDDLLPMLPTDQRRLAIRLALLPGGGGPVWDAIKAEVLDGLDAGLIDDLSLAKVLESAVPPGFGHAKRWEMAKAWFIKHRRNGVRDEAAALIPRLAAPIRDTAPAAEPNAMVLSSLLPAARDLGLDDLPLALCQSAASMFGALGEADDALLRGARRARAAQLRAVAPLLAMALSNTLYHAKDEQDLARRDALLAELRALAQAHPADAAVREWLAKGLFNTLNDAKDEQELARRDALLAELRALAKAHPGDAAVRVRLAKGLFNTLYHAKDEQDRPLERPDLGRHLARRDALLAELRALAKAHPEDPAVRQQLAKGLFNTLNHAKDERDLACRDGLLAELRALAEAHPEDPAVRQQLAGGLFNTLNHAKDEQDLARRDGLLAELRALAKAHPEDAAMREPLAKGLARTTLDAAEAEKPGLEAALRTELLALAEAHPQDGWVEQFRSAGLL